MTLVVSRHTVTSQDGKRIPKTTLSIMSLTLLIHYHTSVKHWVYHTPEPTGTFEWISVLLRILPRILHKWISVLSRIFSSIFSPSFVFFSMKGAGEGTKRKWSWDFCNLCKSQKQSGMVKCNTCDQWQHTKCIGMHLKHYDSSYKCNSCMGGKH